jgi:hypothetical protein
MPLQPPRDRRRPGPLEPPLSNHRSQIYLPHRKSPLPPLHRLVCRVEELRQFRGGQGLCWVVQRFQPDGPASVSQIKSSRPVIGPYGCNLTEGP